MTFAAPPQSRPGGSGATGVQVPGAGAHPGHAPAPAPGLLDPAAAIASARSLTKIYGKGETTVHALAGIDVDFARGELTAIMGPSGSGKSTLMHCMAALDRPTSGDVVVDGCGLTRMKERELTKLRRTRLGFVFQAFNLVPTLSAQENITLPLDIARAKVDREWFDTVIDAVGLRDRLTHRPGELSGGQQQRVACARALIAKPSVVFADEPTGNLDSASSRVVLGFLRSSTQTLGQSVVMVTHDPTAATYADRVLFRADGALVGDLLHPTPDTVIDALRSLAPPHGHAPSGTMGAASSRVGAPGAMPAHRLEA
jgi:putative ABC transport system ATP-binding protein